MPTEGNAEFASAIMNKITLSITVENCHNS